MTDRRCSRPCPGFVLYLREAHARRRPLDRDTATFNYEIMYTNCYDDSCRITGGKHPRGSGPLDASSDIPNLNGARKIPCLSSTPARPFCLVLPCVFLPLSFLTHSFYLLFICLTTINSFIKMVLGKGQKTENIR